MAQQLKIRNFLIIKKADFELSKINVIIGPQANGKSIIAKLLYFFQEFIGETYLFSVKNLESKREIEKKGVSQFEKYFPRYTWANQQFELEYIHDDTWVSISRKKSQRGAIKLKLNYSDDLVYLHRKLKSTYRKKLNDIQEEETPTIKLGREQDVFYGTTLRQVSKSDLSKVFQDSIFIPAGRAFFANLQKNVFSFLATNIDIDPFIREFGSNYETSKKFHDRPFLVRSRNKEERQREMHVREKIIKFSEEIVVGKYSYEQEQDWIEYKGRKTNLANASSGQQEALPMLLILLVWPFIYSGINDKKIFFIEEPEAHLFPTAQKSIISILSLIANYKEHSFVITSHSPYVLTAINNLILANDVAKEHGIDSIKGIIDVDTMVDFEDVRAYTIQDGVLTSILDKEERLIGTSIIDSVSDSFNHAFEKLIEIQIGNGYEP